MGSSVEARVFRLPYGHWEVLALALESMGSGRGCVGAVKEIRSMLSGMSDPRPPVIELEVRLYRSAWPDLVSYLSRRAPMLDRLGPNHREWSPYIGAHRKGEILARLSYDVLWTVREYPVPMFGEDGSRA